MGMTHTKTSAFAATGPNSPLAPHTIERRAPGPTDVDIEILYCGICHSDLHSVRNEWSSVMPTTYPIVPGHEIGGIAETQEMLDFCGEHGITADVEVIPIQQVNEAYERLLKSDVKYRFAIDMASLK